VIGRGTSRSAPLREVDCPGTSRTGALREVTWQGSSSHSASGVEVLDVSVPIRASTRRRSGGSFPSRRSRTAPPRARGRPRRPTRTADSDGRLRRPTPSSDSDFRLRLRLRLRARLPLRAPASASVLRARARAPLQPRPPCPGARSSRRSRCSRRLPSAVAPTSSSFQDNRHGRTQPSFSFPFRHLHERPGLPHCRHRSLRCASDECGCTDSVGVSAVRQALGIMTE